MNFKYLPHKKGGQIVPLQPIQIPFYLKGNLTTLAFTNVFLISI
jgi:hypothetical protein